MSLENKAAEIEEKDGEFRIKPGWRLRFVVTGQVIMQGCLLPRGWGIAYWLAGQDACVCYPVPLNLVVRYARLLYLRMRHPRTRLHEVLARKAYKQGYRDGIRQN